MSFVLRMKCDSSESTSTSTSTSSSNEYDYDDGGIAGKKRSLDDISITVAGDESNEIPKSSEHPSTGEAISRDPKANLDSVSEPGNPDSQPDNLSVLQSAASLLALGASPGPSKVPKKSSDLDVRSGLDAAVRRVVPEALYRPRDILCGRGRGFFNHPGNRRMLEIVERNKGRYRAAGKTRKTAIVREVTEEIQDGGTTSFLKRNGLNWYEVTPAEAHKKVCHCLREEKSSNEGYIELSTEAREAATMKKTVEIENHLNQVKRSLLRDDRACNNVLQATKGDLENGQEEAEKILSGARDHLSRETSQSDESVARDPNESHRSQQIPAKNVSSSNSADLTGDEERPVDTRQANEVHSGLDHAHRPDMNESRGPFEADGLTSATGNGAQGLPRQHTEFRNELDILGAAAAMKIPTGDPHGVASLQESGGLAADGNVGGLDRMRYPAPLGQQMMDPHAARFPQEHGKTTFEASTEDFNEKFGIVMGEPRPQDILFGLDPSFYRHSGNINLRNVIQNSLGYSASTSEKKLSITRRIIAELKMAGSRFLTRQRTGPLGLWYRIEEAEAEALIFRCLQEEETKMQSVLAQSTASMPSTGMEDSVVPENAGSAHATSSVRTNGHGPGMVGENGQRIGSNAPHPNGEKTGNGEAVTPSQIKSSDGVSRASISDSSTASEDDFVHPQHLPSLPPPTQFDVICGRGRGNFRHPGNRRMLRLFHQNKGRYRAGTKLQKTLIGNEIVSDIRNSGGRFLKRGDDGSWAEVGEKVALRKVCHGIRDIPKDPRKIRNSIGASQEEKDYYYAVFSASHSKNSLTDDEDASIKVGQRETGSLKARDKPEEANTPTNKPPGVASPKDQSCLKRAQDGSVVIEVPRELDVLCGRGRGHFGHTGNRRMLGIIHQNKARYKAGTKLEKGQIAREIMAEVQSNGARFLRRKEEDNTLWELCDYSEALNKVCHGIRDSLCNHELKRKKRVKKLPAFITGEAEPEGAATLGGTAEQQSPAGIQSNRQMMLELAIAEEDAARNALRMGRVRPPTHLDGSNPQEMVASGQAMGGPGGAGVDPYLLAMQGRGAPPPDVPMHMLMAAQQAAAANPNLTPEEVAMLMREQHNQQGRACVIS